MLPLASARAEERARSKPERIQRQVRRSAPRQPDGHEYAAAAEQVANARKRCGEVQMVQRRD